MNKGVAGLLTGSYPKLGWLLTLFACLMFLAAACGGDGEQSEQSPGVAVERADVGELIFVSGRDGNDEIYRVRADGSGLTNLTNDPGDDASRGFNEGANFDWSPDGERIAFASDRGGTRSIHVMNADGSAQMAISSANDASQPRWSPDGETVMFVSQTDGADSIYLVQADGTGETRLHNGSAPDWSPDGKSIAFVGDEGIMKMDADGSNVTVVVESGDQHFDVFWSPDGTRLLFSGYREGDNGSLYSKIFVVNEDGSGLIGLPPNTNNEDHYGAPAWSPDGGWITYYSDEAGIGLYTMSADGSNISRLVDAALGAKWSPDGSRLTFVGGSLTGSPKVYVMNVDGTDRVEVASDPTDLFVAWSPVYEASDDVVRATPLRPGTPSPSPTPTPKVALEANGVLGFSVQRQYIGDRPMEMYEVGADGSAQAQIVAEAQDAGQARWSPDRSLIAYTSTLDCYCRNLAVMNADGSNPVQLTDFTEEIASDPAWSPDGTRIAFFLEQDPRDPESIDRGLIYVVHADGSGLALVTDKAANPTFTSNTFDWSPDGMSIAFVSEQGGNREIYVINVDGTGLRNLTNHPGEDSNPSWSPDGGSIVFVSERASSSEQYVDSNIFVMAADGTGQRAVIDTPYDDYDPAWSPDGETIAFLSDYDRPQVQSVKLDGSGLRQLTEDDDERKAYLTWSPDGRAIAFAALDEDDNEADGLNEIRVMNADGSGLTRVFTNREGVRGLVWLR